MPGGHLPRLKDVHDGAWAVRFCRSVSMISPASGEALCADLSPMVTEARVPSTQGLRKAVPFANPQAKLSHLKPSLLPVGTRRAESLDRWTLSAALAHHRRSQSSLCLRSGSRTAR